MKAEFSCCAVSGALFLEQSVAVFGDDNDRVLPLSFPDATHGRTPRRSASTFGMTTALTPGHPDRESGVGSRVSGAGCRVPGPAGARDQTAVPAAPRHLTPATRYPAPGLGGRGLKSSFPRHRSRWGIVTCLALLVLATACDRQPDAATASEAGVLPVLVAPVQEGPFTVERRFTGQIRATRQVRITVREQGQVVEVAMPFDMPAVTAGQVLVRLRSPELELELQEARVDLDSATAALRRRQELANLGLAASAEVEEHQAAVDRAATRLERLQLRREQLTVRTPMAGTLATANGTAAPVTSGQWCPVGLEVARVVDPTSLVVEVVVPDAFSEQAAAVDRAVLEPPGGGELAAAAVSLSAEVEPERGGRILTLSPDREADRDRFLVANALLPVRLVITSRPLAMTVPVQALVEHHEGGWMVYRAPQPGDRGRVVQVKVVPGPDDGRRVVIEEGLEPGIWVVMAGSEQQLSPRLTYLGVGQ